MMRHGRSPVLRFGLCIAIAALVGPPARPQAPKKELGEKYALLVGVRQYDPNELRSLAYSEPDVDQLAQVLKDDGYRRVELMTQTTGAQNFRYLPTAANIRRSLKGLLEDRDEADSVVVALAGHGVQFRGSDASFFCPMDAKLADPSTLIALGEVYSAMEQSQAGVKLLLVDACRNDPQSDNSRSRSVVSLESITRPQLRRPPGGVVALFSCSPGEKAFESAALKHGVFYHYLIEGLKGAADLDRDGSVDVDELARYTRRQVPDRVKEEYGDDVRQMPVLKGEIRGLPVLVSMRRTPPPVVMSPRPQPPGPPNPALLPTVHITKPPTGSRTSNRRVLVEVEVASRGGGPVTALQMFVNGRPAKGEVYRSGPAKGDANGRIESQWLSLQPGNNLIAVEASSRDGRSLQDSITVLYNPSVTIRQTKPTAPKEPYLGLVRNPKQAFNTKSLYLSSPHYDSPAAKAGIKANDILTRFNGAPINTWSDYKVALARCRPGQVVRVELGRINQSLTLVVTLTAGKEDE